MRVPGRVRFTWDDDRTLKLEADAGTQTRPSVSTRRRRSPRRAGRANPSPSGNAARRTRGRGECAAAWCAQSGHDEPKSGYLRKNGIPYSEDAKLTEYFDVVRSRNGDALMMVTSIVDDPKYLRQPDILTTQFKKQPDAKSWDPTPCSSTW